MRLFNVYGILHITSLITCIFLRIVVKGSVAGLATVLARQPIDKRCYRCDLHAEYHTHNVQDFIGEKQGARVWYYGCNEMWTFSRVNATITGHEFGL